MKRYVLLGILCAAALYAQNVSSSLSGTVEDATGARFAGAEVALIDQDTGFIRTTKTNAEGFFSFPDAKAAVYKLTVSSPGFKRYEQSGIALSSSEQRSLGVIRLEVGDVTQSVEVTAEVNPVMLNSGERAGLLTGEDIQDIALRGRDFLDSVGLLPGIIDTADSREAPSADSLKNIYILGGRENSKNMSIDGISAVDSGNSAGVMIMPSMDAVGEMRVLMSNYSAEYGRKSGGTISIITRGGGRQFRAAAGWYHRHEQFNANNFFYNRNGLDRPPYRYNIVSYNLSGPVYIPGKFNRDRSRLFFFFSQEFQRQLVNYGSRTVRVPTALERSGDFSQTFDLNGRLVPVRDPLNNQTQFPGNVLPASRLTAIGRNILNIFPAPNFVDPSPARRYQWNYISAQSTSYPRDTETARIDYSPKDNLQLYVRFTRTGDYQDVYYGHWIAGSVNFPLLPIHFERPSRGLAGRGTVTVSPSLFNEVNVGFTQNKLLGNPLFPERVQRKTTGIEVPQWNPSINPAGFIPNMTFGGVSNAANPSMNNPMPYFTDCNIYSFVDNASKIWKTHTFKFGLYFEWMTKDQYAGVPNRGAVAFDVDRNNPLDSNQAYANALLGNYANYAEASALPMGLFRFRNLEFYGQDTWRVTGRLTLDYGLRFYRDPPMYDVRDQLAAFVPGYYNPANAPVLLRPGFDANRVKVAVDPLSGKTYPQGFIGTFVPGVGDPAAGMVVSNRNGASRGLYTVPALSLAPRFGFAWDPFGRQKTAIRGGAGVFYDRIAGNPTINAISNPPTVYTPRVYYGSLSALAATAGQKILAPTAMSSLFGQGRMPTVYNYSFGIQQQIGANMVVDVAYVGSLSRHFLWRRDINPVPIGATHLDKHPENRDPTTNQAYAANFLRPYQGYGAINVYEFASTANYNSLQAGLSRRMRKGFQFAASYTFGKALGVAETDTTNVSPFFPPRNWNYGPLNYDRTHVFSARYTWRVPKPGKRLQSRAVSIFADGWELSGITRFQSGGYFTPGFSLVSGQDITGTPSESARIRVIDPLAPPAGRFGPPERGTFGNAGVGILRLPGINNWDLSLYRRIPLGERLAAQLRLETYNTFNHTQFSNVVRNARFDNTGAQIDPTFLEPNAARDGRRIQLAIRLNW
jgi:hypothetical protein